jgi:hypothetical protein
MKELIGIYIIFGILYIFEKKNINKLGNYIGLVIIIAILLSFIKVNYFTYILILVQISALTILFGFIIMLFSDKKYIFNDYFINIKSSSVLNILF